MTVGILTAHCSVNPGASLQAHALCKKVKDMGHEPYLIDYRPWYFTDLMDERKAGERNTPRNRLKLLLLGKRLREKHNKFMAFEEEFYPAKTKRYDLPEELCNEPPQFDAFLCGSDQIWNPGHIHYDGSFFLEFAVSGPGIKASYAASIGQDVLNETDYRFLARHIKNLDFLSVREDSAACLLKSELKCRRVSQNIDPVLLHDVEHWRALAMPACGKLPERYILYYPLQDNPAAEQLLCQIKKDTGLKCVAVISGLRCPRAVDVQIAAYGPREFIDLFDRAEYVLTNSFHGIVFSLLFQKRLFSYRNPVRNSRIESLLRLFGMEGLQADTLEDYFGFDWESIWSRCAEIPPILRAERIKSEQYLNEVLK